MTAAAPGTEAQSYRENHAGWPWCALVVVLQSDDEEVSLGQVYDLAGPDDYTYKEVVEFVIDMFVPKVTRLGTKPPQLANLTPTMADIVGAVYGFMHDPIVTRDAV
ncbi:unnamed protein product, partial [Symbiodinium sp. KB8]